MMSASDKKLKHFIFTPFFTHQNSHYPYDVLDTDFLSKQLLLAKNALGSLENQTNKNFEHIFVLNVKFFDEPKYEFIFSTLKNSTSLPLTFMKSTEIPHGGTEVPALITDALNEYDFVIQSRMDFDDFIYKDAVADTQSKINECDSMLYYGYCKGYEYIYGELYPSFQRWNGEGHISILQSLILKSQFARKIPFFSRYRLHHGKVKLIIKEFLEKNGYEFSENMFQQNLSANAYIYFRHDFSQQHCSTAPNTPLKMPTNRPKLTSADITKKQLLDEFGFHYELKSIK